MYKDEQEQELIQAEVPALAQAIESGSPTAKAWLANWRAKKESPELFAKAQGDEIKKEVAQATPPTTQLTFHSFLGYPTDMTRTSPFFPLNQRDLGKREYLEDYVITSAGWGEIKYSGPRLSIFDEDVLMGLLAFLDQVNKNKDKVELEGRTTYTYQGPALPLLRVLGHKKPGKNHYTQLLKTLKRLAGAVVELSISGGKTKKGKQRPPRKIYISSLLSNVTWDKEKKELSATINPFFYEAFCQGRVTLMDLETRIKLAGSVAKALYRFIQSHKTGKWQGHFLTLADALNIDREKPSFKVKELIKKALTELKKQGIIKKESGFKKDIVLIQRCKVALKSNAKSIT